MMIKPKGRPSSQCKHCKELRKNKNSHPSGACTCGKSKKTVSGSVNKCTCKTGEPCSCHSKRKKTDSKLNISTSRLPTDDGSSTFSPQQDSASSINIPSSSASFSWSNSTSSVPQIQQQSQNNRNDNKIRQIGMDPLTNAKPISQTTRTRVGEVSVPINEYIPNNSNGIGNVNDKMPDVFFQDVPLPFEPGHGLLDLFANNNQTTSVNPYFHDNPNSEHNQIQQQQQERMFSPTSNHSTNSDSNNIRSPNDYSSSSGGLFSSMSINNGHENNNLNNLNQVVGSPDSKISFKRNESVMSLSSIGSNSQMSRLNGSSDSLTSGNYHHYDNMIHKPTHQQRFSFPNNNANNNTNNNNGQFYQNGNSNNSNNNNNDDASSVQSVEVLSLTPSFLDIPTDFKNEKGYFSNNHNNNNTNNNNITPQRSNDSVRNHRFTPSIDSIHSSSSLNQKQSTIPQVHSSLINDNSNSVKEDDENMLTPRETTDQSNGGLSGNNGELDTNFADDAMFSNFNTKLTTSGL